MHWQFRMRSTRVMRKDSNVPMALMHEYPHGFLFLFLSKTIQPLTRTRSEESFSVIQEPNLAIHVRYVHINITCLVGCHESYNDPLQVGTRCQHLFQPIKGSHGQHQETTPVNLFKSSATLIKERH